LRPGTTDEHLVGEILHREGMYRLPDSIKPRVIFDVGANIGIAALYFACVYPEAQIYCFEPLPENLQLLRRNVAPFGSRIVVVPAGLFDAQGSFEYHMSDNPQSFGGGTFCGIGDDPNRVLHLPVVTAAAAMQTLEVEHVDVFKLDTEGAELPILKGVPDAVRRNAQAYIGELHGKGDWEVCQWLTQTHVVGVQKRWDRRCFPFLAVRKDLAPASSLPAAA
jgi:FkbM family methyltransferase